MSFVQDGIPEGYEVVTGDLRIGVNQRFVRLRQSAPLFYCDGAGAMTLCDDIVFLDVPSFLIDGVSIRLRSSKIAVKRYVEINHD